jgi:predicted membrane metal-binding protein
MPGEDAEGIEGVLCYMKQDDMPPMGSYVVMKGTFYAFTHATNPGEFDSAEYYRILDQQGRVMQAECTSRSSGYDGFREKLYQVREYLSLLLDACYDEQDASVMKAMLLGEKGTLNQDIKALYQQNGIIHILAISGVYTLSLAYIILCKSAILSHFLAFYTLKKTFFFSTLFAKNFNLS